MKRHFLYSLSLLLFFTSCVTFKQFDSKAKTARETNYEAFIEMDAGKIISGKKLTHRNHDPYDVNLVRVTNKDNAFTIDGTKYNDEDVVAFQNEKAYHKRYKDMFLIRLVKGKMNLYYFDQTGYDNFSKLSTRKTTFYFDKQDDDDIQPIGLKEFKDALEDNAAALAKLNGYYPKDSYAKELAIEKMVSVVNLYNQ